MHSGCLPFTISRSCPDVISRDCYSQSLLEGRTQGWWRTLPSSVQTTLIQGNGNNNPVTGKTSIFPPSRFVEAPDEWDWAALARYGGHWKKDALCQKEPQSALYETRQAWCPVPIGEPVAVQQHAWLLRPARHRVWTPAYAEKHDTGSAACPSQLAELQPCVHLSCTLLCFAVMGGVILKLLGFWNVEIYFFLFIISNL